MCTLLGKQKKISKKIMSIDNVIGVGVGYKSIRGEVTDKPAVLVFVKKKISKKSYQNDK